MVHMIYKSRMARSRLFAEFLNMCTVSLPLLCKHAELVLTVTSCHITDCTCQYMYSALPPHCYSIFQKYYSSNIPPSAVTALTASWAKHKSSCSITCKVISARIVRKWVLQVFCKLSATHQVVQGSASHATSTAECHTWVLQFCSEPGDKTVFQNHCQTLPNTAGLARSRSKCKEPHFCSTQKLLSECLILCFWLHWSNQHNIQYMLFCSL